MFNFYLSQIRTCARSWITICLQVAVATCLLGLSLGIVIAGAQATGDVGEEYTVLGGMQIAFTVLAVMVMLPLLTSAAVQIDASRIASWQLAGASLKQSSLIYYLMLLGISVLGSVIGTFLALVLWPFYVHCLLATGLPDISQLHQRLTTRSMIIDILSSIGLMALTGWWCTRSVLKLDVMQAVRSRNLSSHLRGWKRPLAALFVLAGVIGGYVGLGSMKPVQDPKQLDGLLATYWAEALGLFVVVAFAGAYVTPFAVRIISGLLPARISGSAFLAQGLSRSVAKTSEAVVMPMAVSAGVVGSIMGMVHQITQVSLARGVSPEAIHITPFSQILVVFSPPLILSAVTTFFVLIVNGKRRGKDISLLVIAGVGEHKILIAAIIEAAVYAISAYVICVGVLYTNAIAMGYVLGRGPIPGAGYAGIGKSSALVLLIYFIFLSLLQMAVATVYTHKDPLKSIKTIDG